MSKALLEFHSSTCMRKGERKHNGLIQEQRIKFLEIKLEDSVGRVLLAQRTLPQVVLMYE